MKKRLTIFLVTLLVFSTSTAAFATDYVTALYGGDISGSDCVDFANAMDGLSGWGKKVVDTTATVKQFKDGDSTSTFLYWSGHGLTSGKMSCYGIDSGGSSSDYINYSDSEAPIMYDEIGDDVSYDSTYGYFYSNSVWNSKAKYVVLAVCNQIGTSDSLTKSWLRTMLGKPNRVNMILGYAGTGPGGWVSSEGDYRDDLIAKDFVKNMKNGMRIRDAWYDANRGWGINYSSSIYNDEAKYDKITSMSDLTTSNNKSPDMILEVNGSVQSLSIDSSIKKTDIKTFDNNYKVKRKRKIISDNVLKSYTKFYFNSDNLESSIEDLTTFLRKKNVLPEDATYDSVDIINLITLQKGGEEYSISDGPRTQRYVIKYSQTFDDTKISNLKDGSYINVYIENGEINMIDINWLDIDGTSKTKNNNKMIDKKTAKDKADKMVEQHYVDENKSKPKFEDCEIVYYCDSESNLVPGWRVSYDGLVFTIPAYEE
ncbi:hypothetical protein [Paramaledivibacter caminithermalis]|jgi:hypothetical protein|uniref:Uncharacterized protein n=1 Tax=Paramaledivibacter caminithermalis (strain DSM 15212 / CIP 107654 / DViRD3) TaxID=1121301 RepID=A0A1M6TUL8_PARC5|nr:hypothetical protein [Paramaledivibacter caminithermalis]SHK60629.1 hypothetical protein SAMN02745912_03798 [Paramaledivibacter caminithermalis DSM 15212]